MIQWYVGASLTGTVGSVELVAGLTVAEVAADCVDAHCVCVAAAIIGGTFVDIWIQSKETGSRQEMKFGMDEKIISWILL